MGSKKKQQHINRYHSVVRCRGIEHRMTGLVKKANSKPLKCTQGGYIPVLGEGRMAEWLRYWTLNREIVGSSPIIHYFFCA